VAGADKPAMAGEKVTTKAAHTSEVWVEVRKRGKGKDVKGDSANHEDGMRKEAVLGEHSDSKSSKEGAGVCSLPSEGEIARNINLPGELNQKTDKDVGPARTTNLHSATVSLQDDGIGVGKKAELGESSDSESSNGEERVFSGEEGEEGEITPSRPGQIAGEPSSASPDSDPLGSQSRIPCLSLHPLLALLHIRLIAPTSLLSIQLS
jgi:hypothetical protein